MRAHTGVRELLATESSIPPPILRLPMDHEQPQEVWSRLATTLGATAAQTIVPSPELKRPSVFSLDGLPRIRVTKDGDEQPELELSTTLGEGGMGVVLGATQVPLGRQVAVKTLRDGRDTALTRQSLLQEAWVIGSLEHPNIVPIYTLGRSDEDQPLIVMKRIEGRTWREILDEEERSLEWHLDLLLHVCRALEYAHDRGIVHRDIKPANVMVGNFGEVYLLDWGVAVSLVDDGSGRFPLAAESRQIAGTPHYMAPELTIENGTIDERTDVYLLGAVLHELITGKPRHSGHNLGVVMMSAYVSAPYDYAEDAPAGLVSICARALAREPDERYQSVSEVREAVEKYLERRSSFELADEAAEKLRLLQSEARGAADEVSRQALVRDLFGQCHFGFEHALRVWPENPHALKGREQAILTMIGWEVASRNAAGAQGLLSQLASPPSEIAEAVEELRRIEERKESELAAHRRDRDLRVASRARVALGAGVALFFSALPFAVSALIRAGHMHHPTGARSIALSFILLVFVGSFKVFGRSLGQNLINRRIINILLFMALCLPIMRVIGVLRNVSTMDVLGFEFVVFGLAASAVAMLTNRGMYFAAGFFFAGGLAAAAIPEYTLEVFGITNGLVGTTMILALQAPREGDDSPG